jgi:hypothetical protein
MAVWWLLPFLGCSGGAEERRPEHNAGSDQSVADSLVLTTASGMEVWFTLMRSAAAQNGRQCVERGLEIRDKEKRIRVPLLYTGAAPVLVNDSTLRAVLWNHCMPGDTYLVDIRSGQPVPERAGNGS